MESTDIDYSKHSYNVPLEAYFRNGARARLRKITTYKLSVRSS